MFKLPYNYTYFICQQSNAQNCPSQASTVCEQKTSRCSSQVQKRQRNQISDLQHPLYHRKRENSRITSTSASLTTLKPLTVDHNKLCNILKEMGLPDHFTCLLRNLYAGQEAKVRTGHGIIDWFQTGKGVCQGCMYIITLPF